MARPEAGRDQAGSTLEVDASNLPTPRAYCGVHRVDAVCGRRGHWAMLDLPALVASGFGDVALIRLPLRCRACERPGHRIVVSGRAYGSDEQPGG